MNTAMPLGGDDTEEVSKLIETLHETSRRLEELTGGEVDTVASRDGRTILLRQAQDQLRHSEAAKQSAILNALPAHIALLNPQGVIVSVNEAWRRFSGPRATQSPGYDVGFNYLEICAKASGETSVTAHEICQGIHSVLDGRSKAFSIEYRSDSAVEDGWFLLTATPLADDRRNGAVVMHLNITEQKQHGIERDAIGAKYRGLLEAAPDAMVVVNQGGEIVLLNLQAEKQFGYRRDELVGQKVTNIIPSGFAERLIADELRSAEEALAQQIGTGIELTALRKDGSEFPIELMLSPLASDGGILVTAAIRNIATRRQLEQQLRQVQKMEAVGQLTGGVAHDFNNLLTVITCTVECIADAVADIPNLAAMAKSIDEAAERGAQLTQRMLAFARKQPLNSSVLDLNDVATRMVEMLRRMLGEDIDVRTMLGDNLWAATADINQVEDAILNLAVNARDAMPTGGKLIIETDNVHFDAYYAGQFEEVAPGDYVSVSVTDSGTGMPADVAERAFEPFFTTKEVGRGTGLGLSMVYGFAKQSRGHVRIYSELGRGTSVKLFLPRAVIDAQGAALVSGTAPVARKRGTERILVVEDDAGVRKIVVQMLKGLGYQIREAVNAKNAVDILDSGEAVDLLFTDIVMPGGMSGWELAEAARAKRPALKALFTSGYSDSVLKERAHVGADVALLTKPYRARSLGLAVRAVLDDEPLTLPLRRAQTG